ncbi:retropepsin-like aspartic protease family protein [Coralliovum pocilloporae]|uniref:retropepsin-like aspartic protease family protein n=1 Tax=Coralliovum pocilloporae TaxID=3066369 RepID=UPI003307A340
MSRNFRYGLGIAILIITMIALMVLYYGDFVSFERLTGFASIATMIALAIVIGGGLFSGRVAISDHIKNFLHWVGIFLVIVAAYAYRFELQAIAARTIAALAPGSELAQSLSVETGDGVTIFRSVDGQFHVDTRVDGVPVSMLVDTGASSVVLSYEDAEAIGIDMDRLVFSLPVATANGRAEAAITRIGHLAIGPIGRYRIDALVAKQGALGTSLLGMSFLSQLSGWEVEGDRLTLRP